MQWGRAGIWNGRDMGVSGSWRPCRPSNNRRDDTGFTTSNSGRAPRSLRAKHGKRRRTPGARKPKRDLPGSRHARRIGDLTVLSNVLPARVLDVWFVREDQTAATRQDRLIGLPTTSWWSVNIAKDAGLSWASDRAVPTLRPDDPCGQNPDCGLPVPLEQQADAADASTSSARPTGRTRREERCSRKTKGKKFHAALVSIWDWCKQNRHKPMAPAVS